MKEDEERCLAAGMDGFVTKPIDETKLLRVIAERLIPGGIPAEGAGEGRSAGPGRPMDLAAALDRVDGDRAFLGEMAAMFLAESPGLMAQIRDALARGDAPSWSRRPTT